MQHEIICVLGEALYQRAQQEAARQRRSLGDLLREALGIYLDERGAPPPPEDAVARSWGALKLKPALVKAVLEEEAGLLDT